MKGLFTYTLLLILYRIKYIVLLVLLLWQTPMATIKVAAISGSLLWTLIVVFRISPSKLKCIGINWMHHQKASYQYVMKEVHENVFAIQRFTIILVCLLATSFLHAQITGTVFRDYNASGTRTNTNPAEPGERNITVTAYKPDGSTVVATTDASGNYSFTAVQIPSGTKVRLEFTGLPTSTYNGVFGTGNGTSVQFVTAPATSANIGVLDAVEFCQTAPDLYTPCYVSGDPLISGTSGSMPALVKWNYAYTGTTPAPSMTATASAVGSVWGMAYQRESKKLFGATVLKRHVGLGSLGIGGIYLTDLNTNVTTPYINLSTLGVTLASPAQITQLGTRALPSTATSSSSDANVLGMVGKVGLGGMAIDPDGGKLWVMNVYEKKLVSIAIGSPAVPGASITAANISQFAVPNPGCTNGEYRPWAVSYYRGKIYVGVVCDGGTTTGVVANLFAHVYEFDPATSTFSASPIFSTTLNYTKGDVHTGDAALGNKWEPWRDTWASIHTGSSSAAGVRSARVQPILSAIEFDTDGSLILGLMDRGGHQLGFKQQAVPNNGQFYNGYVGGDILRAQFNVGAGTYTLESNGTSGAKVGCGVGNTQGPVNGEFFCADNYPSSGSVIHEETFQGAMTIVPGTGELTAMSMDPLAVWSGGPNYMSLGNGANIRRYNIYTTVNGSGTQIGQSQGKANGLGMIAVGCNPAPIEIGNYVWIDADGDGVQDPTELPLAGITVELLKSNVVISTAITDVSGRYIFSNQTGTSTASLKYGIALLQANMAYQVRIPNVAGGSKQVALGSRSITTQTNDPSAGGTTRDSDGVPTVNDAVASVTTGASGNNDHRVDFGFKPTCTLTDAGLAVACDDNGTVNTGADDRFVVTLNPLGSALAATYNVTGGITAGPVNYGSAQQVGGFFNISGGSLTITITDATDANCKLTNVVVVPPNTCSTPPPCLADAPDCGTAPATSASTVEMDNLYFTGGNVAVGTEIQHTIGAVDVRYNIMSSDGTFSLAGAIQTPSFINNHISTGGVGDGVFALVVANNTGATTMINKKFSKPITSLLFSVYDVDQTDVVTITGYLKGGLVTNPTLTAASGTPGFTIASNVATGNGTSVLEGNINGTLNVSFGTQALDSVKINMTGGTAIYRLALGDFTFTSPNAPTVGCSVAQSRVDWNAAGVAYTAGSLDQTFTVAAGGETTDFRFTTSGNTAHLVAGNPAEATGVSTGGFFDAGQPSLRILADPAVSSSMITTSIKLSTPRSDVRFSIGDIDDKLNNRDQVKVQGFFHGALVKPTFRSDATEATFSINNVTATAVPWQSDAAVNNTNFATLNVYFTGAVDSIAIMFSEVSGVANPVQRELRISDILFCSECAFRAPETTLSVTTNGGTTGGGFTTQYALTSPEGTILDIQNAPSFTGTFNPGGYSIYPVNSSGTITNFAVGANINGVLGDCLDASKLMGCNVEVCLPVCDQLVSVTTTNACEGATQNAVITHLAAPGQLALYYSTNANLTAALLYDIPNHANNGIVAVNTNITPTGISTTVPITLPAGNNYVLYAVFAAANPNYIPPYCQAMVKMAAPFNIFEVPVANAGADQTIAVPQNAILTATGGGTYLWSTTAVTQSISVSPTAAATTYTVTVTQNGCTSTDAVVVNVSAPIADAGEDYTICLGETATLMARGGGTYVWSGGAGSTAVVMVSPVTTTTYTVTVTVGAQTSTDEVIVTVITDLPVAGVTPPQTVSNGSLVSLTATAGPYFAWQPNYPDSTATVMVMPPDNTTTTYNVEVWKNGCKAATSTSVMTQPACAISVTNVISNCYDSNGNTAGGNSVANLSVTVNWTSRPGTENITVSVPGATITPQTITVTASSGTATLTFVVPSNGASNTVTANFITTTTCVGTVMYTAPIGPCLNTPCVAGSTGGIVWQDYDNDGIQDAAETQGLAGVTVRAYDCNGNVIGTTTTDALGQYTFGVLSPAPSGVAPIRVEFSNWPSGYNPTANGADGRTDVQFISAPECDVDFGLVNPMDYCQTNPFLVTPLHSNGQLSANVAMSKFPYTSPILDTDISTGNQLGTTWGIAYKRSTQRLFTSSFFKRHSAMGPSGPGAIYQIDPNAAVNGTLFFDMNTVESVGAVPTNATRGLTSAVAGLPNTDALAFPLVGEVSLGDIDITDDEQYFFTINLASKKLYRVPTVAPTVGNVTGWTIPDPGCSGGEWRPFAIKVRGSKVYVGGVCDAATSQDRADLEAFVYEFNPTSGVFTQVMNFPLNFKRGHVTYFGCSTGAQREIATQWNAWTDVHTVFADCGIHDVYPQPMLSDIEFDVDGSMILAFMDRWGHQTGEANNYPNGVFGEQGVTGGDIMRAYNSNGVFQIENNGVVGPLTVGGTVAENNYNSGASNPTFAPAGQGNGGREFYFGDTWMSTHDERSAGGLAIKPGSGEVVVTAMDPAFGIYSNGAIWLSNTTGLQNSAFANQAGAIATFGKGYGIGDIELLCNALPIQIGNYVWIDTDADGVQDPCELPLVGVKVELYKKDGTLIGQTTTGANGEYYFDATNVDTIPAYGTGGFTGMSPNTQYLIVIGKNMSQFNTTTSQLTIGANSYQLTASNTGAGTGADQNDNDGTLLTGFTSGATVLNGYPGYCAMTPSQGSNHTFDFGFKAPCIISSVTATPGACVPATNQYTLTGAVTFINAPTTGTLTVQITGGGSQVFNAPFTSPANYSIAGQTSDGASHTVTATFSADPACTNTVNYMAATTCTSCAISSVTATPGACVPATNQYTVTGSVTFTNAPTTGTLTVQVTGGGSQVFNTPFTSPANYSIAGQTSDGASHTVTTTFSADPACTNTVNYMAPVDCTPCTPPTANFVPIHAQCINLVPQNDGRIVLTAFANTDRFGTSVGGTYSGPAYATASTIIGINQNLQTGIPNIGGGIYTVRLFNGSNTCFTDYVITVGPAFPCQTDPMGFIYCEETGQIITGGTITITPPAGATYLITQNGSTGVYQFFTDAFVSGIYTVTYTPPAGYMLSTTRLSGPTFDPTGQPNPYILGSGSTNGLFLDDFTTGSNPFYMSFNLASGDPEILSNNIPLKGCCVSPALTVTSGSVCAGGSVDLASFVTSGGGGTLSYYTTQANANAGTNALPSSMVTPASATNYYVRSQTAANCYTVKEVTIVIQAAACGVITISGPN